MKLTQDFGAFYRICRKTSISVDQLARGTNQRKGSGCRGKVLELMQEFVLGQKWIMTDAVFGTFVGEVIEVSEGGASGSVVITDDEGNEVDTFTGTAAEFRASGEWRLLYD